MNRISHVVIVLTPMTISSFTIATLSILSPPSVIPTAMRVTDFFVSVDARGFSHAMENRRLLCIAGCTRTHGKRKPPVNTDGSTI